MISMDTSTKISHRVQLSYVERNDTTIGDVVRY
jgi:hypothetical protein